HVRCIKNQTTTSYTRRRNVATETCFVFGDTRDDHLWSLNTDVLLVSMATEVHLIPQKHLLEKRK
uniref:Uncharacterized protein n=1 Tax=Gasterosteus aculeatus TaxID=69293 RepID=G3PEJ0_GASAC